jgi:hypothetical protein
MFTTYAKNLMLGALAVDFLSAHDGYPGLTGANEISGGAPAYARKAVTFGAAAGGVRTTSGAVTFDIGAGKTVRWVGAWQAGNFVGAAPSGGSPLEFVVDPTTDVFRCPAHGLSDTNTVVVYNGTAPGGLTLGTVYFVRDATADTFKLAATSGGVALDITSAGSADCLLSLIVESFYAAQGTHTFNTGDIGLPL